MTVEMFLFLLAFFATLTSLFTEAVKKMLDSVRAKYASNIIVLMVSIAVGCLGMAAFYALKGYPLNLVNGICIALMVFSNWLGAMLGYDKVKQAIKQFKGK